MAFWDQMRVPPSGTPTVVPGIGGSQAQALPKLMVWLILFMFVTYVVYILKLVSSSHARVNDEPFSTSHRLASSSSSAIATNSTLSSSLPTRNNTALTESEQRMELRHVVFRIAASSELWEVVTEETEP